MSTALLPSTQVTITFAIHITTDREAEMLTLLFVLLWPFLFLRHLIHTIHRFWNELILMLVDTRELLVFIAKVIVITFNAFAFGLGIKR